MTHYAPRLLIGLVCLLVTLSTSASEPVPYESNSPPSSFDLKDWNRHTHTLEHYRGSVVLVNFWASWCAPCLNEIPDLKRLGQRMEDNPFSILAINVEETRRKVKWLVDYLNPHITILFDRDRAVFNAWEGIVLPTSFLLDRQGHVRYVVKGPYDWDAEQAIDIIEKLLGESTTGMVNHTDPAID